MTRAFIGIGSNQNHPPEQLDKALRQLISLSQTSRITCSPRYWTAPWGEPDQPDFLNAVAAIDTRLDAEALLQALLAIESNQGRTRNEGQRWGPRPIDLDLLLYGEQIFDQPELQVPHPRMTQRAFVLVPLLDLAPDLMIPGRGAARDYLKGLDQTGLRPAENATPSR